MKSRVGARASRRLAVGVVSIVLPGLVLGYVGVRSLADRSNGLRTTYTATTALVRDRLVAELTRLESELATGLARRSLQPDDADAGKAWLRNLSDANQWLVDPFLLHTDGGVITTDLSAGRSRVAEGRAADPLVALPKLASIIRDAELAEFVDVQLDRALLKYRQALGAATSDSARGLVLMRIGRTLFKLRRFDEGIAQYQTVAALAPEVVDSHGRPAAVNALMEIADGLDTLGRAGEKPPYQHRLLQLIVEHPWNAEEGYGYYLGRAVESTPASAERLRARADELTRAAANIQWIDREIRPRMDDDLKRGVWTETTVHHFAAERDDQPTTISAALLSEIAGDSRRIVLGYQIRPGYIAGPLLASVLKTVDLGGQINVQVIRDPTGAPLALADLETVLPGWRVGVFHRDGRSLDQLIAREGWIYGSLIVGLIGVLIAGITLTMRASAREAELSRLKTDFVSNVSHELKTPLALIRMFGETLESGIVTDEARRQEFYGIIRRESDRLTHLINNVLDVAKIDAGTKQYTLAPGDAVAVVREVIEAYSPLLDRLGFSVDANLPVSPMIVSMDRDAIAQALVNLFQNAIKYSGEMKKVSVSVVTESGMLRLSVADRGVGIASANIARIFDKHYRVRTNGPASLAGSGLGLSIVKHAIEAHGGRVEVESAPGHGSAFTLLLPLQDLNAADVTQPGDMAQPASAAGR